MEEHALLEPGETLCHSQHGDVTFREVVIKPSKQVRVQSDEDEEIQLSPSSDVAHVVHFTDEDGTEHRELLSVFTERTEPPQEDNPNVLSSDAVRSSRE